MRQVVVHMAVSLDGFFEGPDHDISWHMVDDELHRYMNEQLATMSAFLSGRVTHELMAEFWPTADQDPEMPEPMREFAGLWREMPKIAFSRTWERADWNTTVRHEVDPAEIRALKEQPGGDMTLSGANLLQTFRQHDLVDEYRLFVNPVLLGRGRQLFGPADVPSHLELVETRRFGNGVVLLRHARAS
jgi:dihydrofolate reductase